MNQLFLNYANLSQEDSIEQLNLTNRSFNALTRAHIQTVGEVAQLVESGKLRTLSGLGRKSILEIEGKLVQKRINASEVEANVNITLDQNYLYLLQADPIGELGLTRRSFNALTRARIRTVGETLQLVQSGRLGNIRGLGQKCILEITERLAQVKILKDSEDKGLVKTEPDPITDGNDEMVFNDASLLSRNLLETKEPWQVIGQAVQQLSPKQQRVFNLRYQEGLQLKEIAARLDLSAGTIKAHLHHAHKRLQRLLIPSQNDASLSREDSIEQLNLSNRSFNALVRTGIRTVREVLQLVQSGRLGTIPALGRKSILEITTRLTQVEIPNDTEVKAPASSDALSRLAAKILNDSEVESIIKKDEIPRAVVRWQSQLVIKQISRGLLHEDAIIAEKSIKDWLEDIETIESSSVYEVLAAILDSSLNICEEIELLLKFIFNQISGRDRMTILLSTYGFEAKTLAQTGSELGISRGRVSQIKSKLKDKLGEGLRAIVKAKSISDIKERSGLIRMQSALLIARDLGLNITYEGWTERIRSSGLVGDWTSQDFVGTNVVEVMIAICNLLTDCKIRWLQIPENLHYAVQLAAAGKPKIPAKISHALDTLPDEAKRLINGHTKNSGGIHVKWLSQESGIELENIKNILQWQGYKALSEDWFVPNLSKISYNSVFHRCLRKMCQYCGPLSIDDVCAGLRHVVSERKFPVPPPDVMDKIVRIFDYKCKEGLYYWAGESDEKLNAAETVIMNCLEEIGPVLRYSELMHAFIESELSVLSLPVTLQRTPLFHTIELGLYKLRGKDVSYQEIERAKAAREKQPLRPEVEYDTDGNIIVSITLSAIALGSGTILCERFPDLSGADWECYVNSERVGELSAVENEFRRLKKPFELLNCQPGERLKFAFNTWDRTVTIEKEGLDATG